MLAKLRITILVLIAIPSVLVACMVPGSNRAQMDGMPHEMDPSVSMSAALLPLEGDAFEVAFMDAMIPHHQSAVDMAQVALERTQRPELKAAAQAIIDAQLGEIAEMKRWLQTWHGESPSGMSHGMDMGAEIEALRAIPAEEFDVAFLTAMIPHHADAIQMAELVADRSDRPELNDLAEAIISSQQQEIEQFEQWISEWGGAP